MRAHEPPHLDRGLDLHGHEVTRFGLPVLRDGHQVPPGHAGVTHAVVPDPHEEVGRFPFPRNDLLACGRGGRGNPIPFLPQLPRPASPAKLAPKKLDLRDGLQILWSRSSGFFVRVSTIGTCDALRLPMVRCAWKLHFYPTPRQERALAPGFGCSQFVWISAFESQRNAYARRGSVQVG